jgi:hypothetical protein|tara:strand:+ start:1345 stop:1698 length:354 start_codon:yes stop_codon:yes gene_type:complete
MNIEEMKAFAALTDEEREKKIKIEEAKKTAKEDFYLETFNDWNGYYEDKTANCGCGDTYWMITDEYEAKNMCFCFDKYGKIGSDWESSISVGSLTCTNCGGKPKMPQWYLEEYLEAN